MANRRVLLGATCLIITAPLLPTVAMAASVHPGAQAPLPPTYVPDLEPPNPVAGQCYARIEIPAQYETVNRKVVKRDGHERLMVQQAQLHADSQQVMVREPSVRFEVRQPTYGTVTEQIMTRPAYEKLTVTEPRFKAVTETTHHGRPRLVWKRGNPIELRAQGYVIHSVADGGVNGQGYSSTTQYGATGGQRCGASCDIWCLVEEPGESLSVTRKALVEPGRVHRTPVPPQFQTITKHVVTDPGGVREIPISAEYTTLQVDRLVRPGSVAAINVAPEYGHAQGRRLVTESRYEWRRIVCVPGTPRVSHHNAPTVSHRAPVHSSNFSQHGLTTTHPTVVHRPTVQYGSGHSLAGGHRIVTHPSRTIVQTPQSSQSLSTYSAPFRSTQPSTVIPPTVSSGTYPDRTYSGPAYSR